MPSLRIRGPEKEREDTQEWGHRQNDGPGAGGSGLLSTQAPEVYS